MNLLKMQLYNTKFIENNLSLFTEKMETIKKIENDYKTTKKDCSKIY